VTQTRGEGKDADWPAIGPVARARAGQQADGEREVEGCDGLWPRAKRGEEFWPAGQN
jgi:hypothetical protein